MFWWILALVAKTLTDQRGQIPTDLGDTGDTGDGNTEGQPTSDPLLGDPAGPAASETQQTEESFIDPSTLPDEIKPHWRRMHNSYIKFAQERKQLREQAAIVERFQSDPQFAEQILQQRAAALGYQIIRPGSNGNANAPVTPADAGNIPQEYIQAIQAKLAPELQWMAPSLAAATYSAIQAGVDPIKKQVVERETRQRNEQLDAIEAKMNENYPGWEQHEDSMRGLYSWLKSDSLEHPLYGNKYEMLYKLATQQASSVSEAARRLSAAARNRTSTSQVTSNTQPNIFDRVRKAASNEDAWDAAAKFAKEQLKGRGAT